MTGTKRVRLGRFAGIATRYSVYRTDAAVEIDERDNFEVQRRRVFFDDILLITLHRQFGRGYVAMMAIFTALFATVAIAFDVAGETPVAIVFACFAAPFALLLVLRLLLRVDVITIFGRRTKATLPYTYRKRFARETFDDLTARTLAAQQRLAEELAGDLAPAEPAVEGPVVG